MTIGVRTAQYTATSTTMHMNGGVSINDLYYAHPIISNRLVLNPVAILSVELLRGYGDMCDMTWASVTFKSVIYFVNYLYKNLSIWQKPVGYFGKTDQLGQLHNEYRHGLEQHASSAYNHQLQQRPLAHLDNSLCTYQMRQRVQSSYSR